MHPAAGWAESPAPQLDCANPREGTGIEAIAPQSSADERNRHISLLLVERKRAPWLRLSTEDRQKIVRGTKPFQSLRPTARGQIGAAPLERRYALERPPLLLPIEEVGARGWFADKATLETAGSQGDQAIRVVKMERAEQNGIKQTENRGRGADRKRKVPNRGESEGRASQQRTSGAPQIRLHSSVSVGLINRWSVIEAVARGNSFSHRCHESEIWLYDATNKQAQRVSDTKPTLLGELLQRTTNAGAVSYQ
jgi:hypothetical protein